MTKEELFYILDSGADLTEDDLQFGLELFGKDAQAELAYISKFSYFSLAVASKFSEKYCHDLHLINRIYINSLETSDNPDSMSIGFLYASEIQYFMQFDVYSEALRRLWKALDMGEAFPTFYRPPVLINLMTIVQNSGYIEELPDILKQMEELLRVDGYPDTYRFLLPLSLMEGYALLGNMEKSEEYYGICKNFSSPETVYYTEMARLSIQAKADFFTPPSDEYIERVRACVKLLNKEDGLLGEYYEYFAPIFTYIRGHIPDIEIEKLLIGIIDNSRFPKDRIKLYRFLFTEFEVGKESAYDLYESYYEDLKNHFEMQVNMQKSQIIGDLSGRKQMKKYKDFAETDALTGLGNRRAFDNRVEECLRKGKLLDNLYMVSMDLNGLKGVNDNFGHQAGDEFISAAAECVRTSFADIGNAFRTGGDEFLAIVYADEGEMAKRVAVMNTKTEAWSKEHGRALSISVGYACTAECNYGEAPNEEIFTRMTNLADERMYAAKKEYYTRTGVDRRRR